MELLEWPRMLHCQYILYSAYTHCDGVARAMDKEKCTAVEACSHGLGHHSNNRAFSHFHMDTLSESLPRN